MRLAIEAYPEVISFSDIRLLSMDVDIIIINKSLKTISSIRSIGNGYTVPTLYVQEQLTNSEMSILLPMLNIFPRTCFYEVLLSSLISSTVDLVSIDCWLQRLEEARNRGTGRQLLKPLNRAVSSLRPKLHALNLDIVAIRGLGYSITKI
jgi:hypothetical protein